MSDISENEHLILTTLGKSRPLTMYYMEKKMGLDKTTIKYWINKLVNKGLVIKTTTGNKTTYVINPDTVVTVDGVLWAKIKGQVLIFGAENNVLCQKISKLFRG